jgi:hypothetical protein
MHDHTISELQNGLPSELHVELQRLALPFTDDSAPSDAELRIAQAQLKGWLEGLFRGIQTVLTDQQTAGAASSFAASSASPTPSRSGSSELAGSSVIDTDNGQLRHRLALELLMHLEKH